MSLRLLFYTKLEPRASRPVRRLRYDPSVSIAIVIPVLGRPQRAAAVFASVEQATTVEHRVAFVCSPFDWNEHAACAATGADVFVVEWEPDRADWAKKINHVYRRTDEDWVFLAADDLRFHKGWDVAALQAHVETDARVIGTNDLANPRVIRGEHSTHTLVHRSYADALGTIDGPGEIVSEAYDHQFCDDELVLTAKRREEWAFASASVVEHLHPYFRKGKMDETYKKATRATREDSRVFADRKRRI